MTFARGLLDVERTDTKGARSRELLSELAPRAHARSFNTAMITSGTLGGPIRAGDDDGQRGRLMFIKHKSAFSRRDAPELCVNLWPRKLEGAGNAGRLMRPQPRVQSRKHTSVVTTVTPG